MDWEAEFFTNGHSLEYINDMSYWDFNELTSHLGKKRNENSQRASGKTVMKFQSPSQKKMIADRKKLEALGKI